MIWGDRKGTETNTGKRVYLRVKTVSLSGDFPGRCKLTIWGTAKIVTLEEILFLDEQ